jgi:hypothetical protein
MALLALEASLRKYQPARNASLSVCLSVCICVGQTGIGSPKGCTRYLFITPNSLHLEGIEEDWNTIWYNNLPVSKITEHKAKSCLFRAV